MPGAWSSTDERYVTRLVSIVVINLTIGMYNYIHKSYKEYNVSLYMCRLITVYIG